MPAVTPKEGDWRRVDHGDGRGPVNEWYRDGKWQESASRSNPSPRHSAADTIRRKIADLQAELKAVEAIPDLFDFEEGTVLVWEREFATPGKDGQRRYTYAALKGGVLWYPTAQGSKPLSDDEMRAELARLRTVDGIWYATALEPLT